MSSFDTATTSANVRIASPFDTSSVTGMVRSGDGRSAAFSATPLDILRSLTGDVATIGVVAILAASMPTSPVVYSLQDAVPTGVTWVFSRRRRRISLREARALAIAALHRAERIRDAAAQEEWKRSSYFAELA
ncbi:MAG: hypothetical protein IT478_17315 [Xanthomonadales bacterium]|nr:hypothetical protein [Xanthomonadales bacterium]